MQMNGNESDLWEQLINEYSWHEPDSPPLPTPIETLLLIATKIRNDVKAGTDNNKRRETYFKEAGMLLGRGAPPKDKAMLNVLIRNSTRHQQALLVMLEQRGITTNKNTVASVLATTVSFADSQILTPYRVNKEMATLEGADLEALTQANSDFKKKLYEEHRKNSVVSISEATKRVSAWINKQPKSLENAHQSYREQIVLSVHFHAFLRDHENTLNK